MGTRNGEQLMYFMPTRWQNRMYGAWRHFTQPMAVTIYQTFAKARTFFSLFDGADGVGFHGAATGLAQRVNFAMREVKIMPCLDMKAGRVVKGVHFVDLRDAGDPVEHATFYEWEGADELAMLDIAATVENRKTRIEWVRNVSAAVRIPVTVGGGIASLSDIESVLEAGAAKVSVNTAAVKSPTLVEQAAQRFGSERIVVAIDVRRNSGLPSGFEVVVAGGTKPVGLDAIEWAQQCERLGAGALLPTSIDGDGTQAGYDIELLRAIDGAVRIPVIASGGAGKLEHFYDAVANGGASVLLAASVFHFRILSIRQVKEYLRSKGVPVRL